MNNLFNIQVKLDEIEEDQHVHSGVLQITPHEDLAIEQIKAQLFMNVKGKMASQHNNIDNFEISSGFQQLSKNETYNFPFKYILKSDIGTYKGKNVHIFYDLEFAVKLEKESFKRLDKNPLKSIKSLVTGNTDYKYSKTIIVRKPPNYDIAEGYKQLAQDNTNTLAMLLFSAIFIVSWLILFGALKLNKIVESWDFVLIIGIIVSIVLGYFAQLAFFRGLVGSFAADIQKKDDKSFVNIIHSTGNWRYIREAKTYYEIVEEVVDDRGTSSSTYTETIYVSDNIPVSMENNPEEIIHEFPRPNSVPPTININNVSVKWLIVVELVTSVGVTLKFKRIIHQ